MVKLMITSGCMFEIQSTSPNSRSYPWNIQCLSPNHFKNPIHIPYTFVKISTSLRLSLACGLLISIISSQELSATMLRDRHVRKYNQDLLSIFLPAKTCREVSSCPTTGADLQLCNVQVWYILTFAFLLYNRSIHRGGLYSIYDLYPVLKLVYGAKVGEINNRLNKNLVGGFNPSEKY